MYPHERTLVNDMRGRPFTLLGVNNDSKISTVKKAVKKNNINWRSWYDGKGGAIVKDFGIRSFPTIFLVDHTGVIRYKNLRGKKLDQALGHLVAEAEAAGMSGVGEIAAKHRKYEDVTGKHSIFAKFKSFVNDEVTLEQRDGSEVVLPLEKLSSDDRDYLQENGFLMEVVSHQDSLVAKLESDSGDDSDSDEDLDTVEDTAADVESASLRLFVDSTGQFKIKASLVESDGDSVVLRKESGEEISMALERLSEKDQDYIRKSPMVRNP